MLWRCSVCGKAGLEDDFVYAPIDELHETVYCFKCAPEDAMKQAWPIDEGDAKAEDEQTP